jgi:hypothetical protein
MASTVNAVTIAAGRFMIVLPIADATPMRARSMTEASTLR